MLKWSCISNTHQHKQNAAVSVYSNARRASLPEVAVWLSRPCVFPQPRLQTFPEALSELCLNPRRAAQSPWSAGPRLFPQPSACGGKATNRCRAQRGTDTIFFSLFFVFLSLIHLIPSFWPSIIQGFTPAALLCSHYLCTACNWTVIKRKLHCQLW